MMSTIRQITRRISSASVLTVLIAAVVGLAACDAVIGTESDGTARLRVRMIDAPFPFDLVESANVTISRVDVHSETSGDVTISNATETYNLLDLQNGVSALLGEVDVEPGTYHEVRLYVESASIVLKDETEFDIQVPSDRIKVLLDAVTVSGGEDVTLTIDFDVSKSFVMQGDPLTPAGIKGFLFTPTVVPAGVERDSRGDDASEEVDGEDEGEDDGDGEADGIGEAPGDDQESEDEAGEEADEETAEEGESEEGAAADGEEASETNR